MKNFKIPSKTVSTRSKSFVLSEKRKESKEPITEVIEKLISTRDDNESEQLIITLTVSYDVPQDRLEEVLARFSERLVSAFGHSSALQED